MLLSDRKPSMIPIFDKDSDKNNNWVVCGEIVFRYGVTETARSATKTAPEPLCKRGDGWFRLYIIVIRRRQDFHPPERLSKRVPMTGHALFPASPRAISKSLPESETQTLEPPQGGREDGNRIGFRHRRRSERVIPGNTPSFPISAVQNLSAPFLIIAEQVSP